MSRRPFSGERGNASQEATERIDPSALQFRIRLLGKRADDLFGLIGGLTHTANLPDDLRDYLSDYQRGLRRYYQTLDLDANLERLNNRPTPHQLEAMEQAIGEALNTVEHDLTLFQSFTTKFDVKSPRVEALGDEEVAPAPAGREAEIRTLVVNRLRAQILPQRMTSSQRRRYERLSDAELLPALEHDGYGLDELYRTVTAEYLAAYRTNELRESVEQNLARIGNIGDLPPEQAKALGYWIFLNLVGIGLTVPLRMMTQSLGDPVSGFVSSAGATALTYGLDAVLNQAERDEIIADELEKEWARIRKQELNLPQKQVTDHLLKLRDKISVKSVVDQVEAISQNVPTEEQVVVRERLLLEMTGFLKTLMDTLSSNPEIFASSLRDQAKAGNEIARWALQYLDEYSRHTLSNQALKLKVHAILDQRRYERVRDRLKQEAESQAYPASPLPGEEYISPRYPVKLSEAQARCQAEAQAVRAEPNPRSTNDYQALVEKATLAPDLVWKEIKAEAAKATGSPEQIVENYRQELNHFIEQLEQLTHGTIEWHFTHAEVQAALKNDANLEPRYQNAVIASIDQAESFERTAGARMIEQYREMYGDFEAALKMAITDLEATTVSPGETTMQLSNRCRSIILDPFNLQVKQAIGALITAEVHIDPAGPADKVLLQYLDFVHNLQTKATDGKAAIELGLGNGSLDASAAAEQYKNLFTKELRLAPYANIAKEIMEGRPIEKVGEIALERIKYLVSVAQSIQDEMDRQARIPVIGERLRRTRMVSEHKVNRYRRLLANRLSLQPVLDHLDQNQGGARPSNSPQNLQQACATVLEREATHYAQLKTDLETTLAKTGLDQAGINNQYTQALLTVRNQINKAVNEGRKDIDKERNELSSQEQFIRGRVTQLRTELETSLTDLRPMSRERRIKALETIEQLRLMEQRQELEEVIETASRLPGEDWQTFYARNLERALTAHQSGSGASTIQRQERAWFKRTLNLTNARINFRLAIVPGFKAAGQSFTRLGWHSSTIWGVIGSATCTALNIAPWSQIQNLPWSPVGIPLVTGNAWVAEMNNTSLAPLRQLIRSRITQEREAQLPKKEKGPRWVHRDPIIVQSDIPEALFYAQRNPDNLPLSPEKTEAERMKGDLSRITDSQAEIRKLQEWVNTHNGYIFYSSRNPEGIEDGQVHVYQLVSSTLTRRRNQQATYDAQNTPDLELEKDTKIKPNAVSLGRFKALELDPRSLYQVAETNGERRYQAYPQYGTPEKPNQNFQLRWHLPGTWKTLHSGAILELNYDVVFPIRSGDTVSGLFVRPDQMQYTFVLAESGSPVKLEQLLSAARRNIDEAKKLPPEASDEKKALLQAEAVLQAVK